MFVPFLSVAWPFLAWLRAHPLVVAYLVKLAASGLVWLTLLMLRRSWRFLRSRSEAPRLIPRRFAYTCSRCLTEVRTNWQQRRCHVCRKRFSEM